MKKCVYLFALSFAYLVIANPAFAHLAEIGGVGSEIEFSDFTGQQFEHPDADPFKGWAFVYVKNTSQVAWGDFHFEIYQYDTSDISNVDFIVDSPFEPVSTQSLSNVIVDNDVVGATLDLEFYNDPVYPGEVATFQLYTDNTTDQGNFGLLIYPSIVPEPATIVLLSLGGAALLRKRRK